MKKAALIILVLILLAGIGLALHHYLTTPRQEGIAHLRTIQLKSHSELAERVSYTILGESGRPADLVDMPIVSVSDPNTLRYFRTAIGQQEVFVLVHVHSATRVSAWVDTNLNGRLSDEKRLSGRHSKFRYSSDYSVDYFDLGTTRLLANSLKSEPFHLGFNPDYRGWLVTTPVTYKTGKIRLENRIFRVAVVDVDYDGLFQTLYRQPRKRYKWEWDAFYLNSDTGGLFGDIYDIGKMYPLGRYYKQEDRYYSIEVLPGDSIKMVQAEPAFGTLKLASPKQLQLYLSSDAATQTVGFSDAVRLPVGLYGMEYGTLTCVDKDGTDWKLYPQFTDDIRHGHFEIRDNQIVTIDPGPPFTVRSNLGGGSEGYIYINVDLVGNEGELYGLRIDRNAGQPGIKIVDEKDAEIHSGTMEYG